MDSDFSFVEIDIRERSSGRDGGIQSESEFSDHDFSFCLLYERIYFLEHRWEISGGHYSSSFHLDEEWFCMNDLETISRICFDERFSRDAFQVYRFGEYLSDRKSTTLVFRAGIISCIPTGSLYWTIAEHMSLARNDSRSQSILYITMKCRFLPQVFRSPVGKRFLKCFELLLLDVR